MGAALAALALVAVLAAARLAGRGGSAPQRSPLFQQLRLLLQALPESVVDDPAPDSSRISGCLSGVIWRFGFSPPGDPAICTLVVQGVPVELRAVPATDQEMTTGGRALPFGEPLFDSVVMLDGPPMLLAAAADPKTRARLIRLVQGGGRVGQGTISWKLQQAVSAAQIRALLQEGVALLHALHRWQGAGGGPDPDLADRLVAALTDAPRRRELAVRCLSRHWPDRLAGAALENLRADPDPHVQAEVFLHTKDWDALTALLSSPRQEIRQRVAEGLPLDRLLGVFGGASGAISAEQSRLLSAEIARRADPATDPAVEAAMAGLLGPANPPHVRQGAIVALGAVGGRAAVSALWEFRQDREMKGAVAAALEQIRARMGRGDVGHVQLALEGGGLTVAEGGGLSLPASNRPFSDAGEAGEGPDRPDRAM